MPRPVFVLGSPRSGTSVIGNFIASHSSCADLGEFFGFYSTTTYLPSLMQRVASPVKREYLSYLTSATRDFADDYASRSGRSFWCDQTPFNIFAVDEICRACPDALFVLTLRHYSGAIQSLQRSFRAGYRWAGGTIAESAALWSRAYTSVVRLPEEATIVVSYDALCAQPAAEIVRLTSRLGRQLGIDEVFRLDIFAESHATSEPRETLAAMDGDDVRLTPIASVDRRAWTDEIAAECRPHVHATDLLLRERYGSAYLNPISRSRG